MAFRSVNNSDLKKIADLADDNGLLLPPIDKEQFIIMLKWLYDFPPKGNRLEFIYDDNGKALAHYGAVPFEFKIQTNKILAAFACNIVIDKEARKKALFFPLQKHFAKLLTELGYGFAYGVMTRPKVLAPHLSVGWKEIGKLNVYARPVNFSNILVKLFPNTFTNVIFKKIIELISLPVQKLFNLITKTLKFNNSIIINEINNFNGAHDVFLNKWMNSQSITSVRSSEILNWRFNLLSNRNYIILTAHNLNGFCGFIVVREIPIRQFKSLAIVDIIAMKDDSKTVSTLLDYCLLIAKKNNVDFISTAFPTHYCFLNILYRKGFIKTDEKFTLVVRSDDENLKNILEDFNSWHISWFDHDFV
jgi:hypothetical protein